MKKNKFIEFLIHHTNLLDTQLKVSDWYLKLKFYFISLKQKYFTF